jgi:hypothetical protein
MTPSRPRLQHLLPKIDTPTQMSVSHPSSICPFFIFKPRHHAFPNTSSSKCETTLLPNDDILPTADAFTECFEKNLLPNGAFSTKLGPQVSLFPIPSMRVLYSHMYVQHVFLVGFVVIVVISLTVWMLRYRCGYTWKCLITLRSDSTVEGKGLAAA